MKNIYYSNLVKSVLFKFPVCFLGSSSPINMLITELLTVLTPFCSQLIQTQLQDKQIFSCDVCVSYIASSCPACFLSKEMCILKMYEESTQILILFKSVFKNLVKGLENFLYFLAPPSRVVRFNALIIFFQGKTSQHILNIKIPDVSVNILW